MVRGDAVEGRDYDLEKLTWLWDVTLKADKKIIEDNQRGIMSRSYEPGPFTEMETAARMFSERYVAEMKAHVVKSKGIRTNL